ncbi:MAG TPA: hypothetical protein VHX52_10400 [Steroidobacteraceae bacterium]|jgi:hypothetical protein|nr:hypothetical protein [Steroidobacteraceae bacterium]
MHAHSLAPRPADGLLGVAGRLYAASFKRCLPLALIGTLLSTAAGAYASARVGALSSRAGALLNIDLNAPDRLMEAFGDLIERAHVLVRSPGVWASYLGAALVVLAFHGALIARQDAVAHERPDSLPGALSGALRRLPSILLVLAIIAVAAAVAVLVLRIASAGGLAVLTLFGLAVTWAAIWLWGRLQLWLVTMFTENLDAVGALRRSWSLVRGHWLRASALTTVPYLIIFALSSLASLGAGAAGGWLRGDTTAAPVLETLISLLSGALTLPMLPAVWLALYRQLLSAGQSARSGV